MAQEILSRDVDDDAMPGTSATDIQADNANLGSSIVPIAVGDPLVPGAIDMGVLLEYIYDNMATWIAGGSNVTITPAKTGGNYTLTIASTDTDTNTQLTATQVFTHVSNFISASGNSMTITEDSTAQTITFATAADLVMWTGDLDIDDVTGTGSIAGEYVERTLTNNHNAFIKNYTVAGSMTLRPHKEGGTDPELLVGRADTYPAPYFDGVGNRITLWGADGTFAIIEYRSSSLIRIFMKEADSGDNFVFQRLVGHY